MDREVRDALTECFFQFEQKSWAMTENVFDNVVVALEEIMRARQGYDENVAEGHGTKFALQRLMQARDATRAAVVELADLIVAMAQPDSPNPKRIAAGKKAAKTRKRRVGAHKAWKTRNRNEARELKGK